MPSKKLTPEQALKQKAALAEFHKNKNKPTSTDSVRTPRAISDMARQLKPLLPDALVNIENCIRKVGDTDKLSVETSKWVITQIMSAEKAALEDRMQRLKLKAQEKQAKDLGLIETKTPAEKAQEFGKPRLIMDYEPEWDEQIEEDDE